MNPFINKKSLRNKNLTKLVEIKNILAEEHNDILELQHIISNCLNELPKNFRETDLGYEFIQFNTYLLVEIDKWLLTNISIIERFKKYEDKIFSINSLWKISLDILKLFLLNKKFSTSKKQLENFQQRIENHRKFPNSIISLSLKVYSPPSSFLQKITSFVFSVKTQKEVFEPTIADWQEEYFEALFKKEIWKARWINVRYTYAFLGAMWQKSPIGDLIEFVSKIAKQ